MTKLVFEIRLAIAKLIVNRRSTLGKSLFFGLLFAVIFSSLMFIAGSDQQMMKSIQAVMGDADCTAIGSSDRVENIGSIADEIASKYMTLFSDVQTMYVTDIEVDTDRAMGVSLCTGAEDSYFKRLKKIVSWRDEEPAGLS